MSENNPLRDREFDSLVRADVERCDSPCRYTDPTDYFEDVNQSAGQSAYAFERAQSIDPRAEANAQSVPASAAQAPPSLAYAQAVERGIGSEGDTRTAAQAFDDRLTTGPLQHAATDLRAANRAIFEALSGGSNRAAKEASDKAISTLLTPYYKGRGKFDHKRFLDDLETTKGGKLSDFDITLFGRVVGIWTGEQLAKEVNDEIEAAGDNRAAINAAIHRGYTDALNSLNS